MERLHRRDSSLTCLEKVYLEKSFPLISFTYMKFIKSVIVIVPQMLTSLRNILAEIPGTESFLIQIEALFITHFIDKRETEQASSFSSHLLEQFKQLPSHTSNASELMDSREVLDYEEMCFTDEQSIINASSSDKGFNIANHVGDGKEVNIVPSAQPKY